LQLESKGLAAMRMDGLDSGIKGSLTVKIEGVYSED
jgi:hypothetical protein